MVEMFVRGNKIGSIAENPQLLEEHLASGEKIEFRTESGRSLGEFVPRSEPICSWEPKLTEEEIDQRCEALGRTLKEIMKEMPYTIAQSLHDGLNSVE
jgi:hypothetical protein